MLSHKRDFIMNLTISPRLIGTKTVLPALRTGLQVNPHNYLSRVEYDSVTFTANGPKSDYTAKMSTNNNVRQNEIDARTATMPPEVKTTWDSVLDAKSDVLSARKKGQRLAKRVLEKTNEVTALYDDTKKAGGSTIRAIITENKNDSHIETMDNICSDFDGVGMLRKSTFINGMPVKIREFRADGKENTIYLSMRGVPQRYEEGRATTGENSYTLDAEVQINEYNFAITKYTEGTEVSNNGEYRKIQEQLEQAVTGTGELETYTENYEEKGGKNITIKRMFKNATDPCGSYPGITYREDYTECQSAADGAKSKCKKEMICKGLSKNPSALDIAPCSYFENVTQTAQGRQFEAGMIYKKGEWQKIEI